MELLTLRLSSSVSPLQRLPRVLTLLSTGSIFWCLTFSVCNRAVREKGGFKLLICLGDTEYWIEGFTKCKNYNMPIDCHCKKEKKGGKLQFFSSCRLPLFLPGPAALFNILVNQKLTFYRYLLFHTVTQQANAMYNI